jgi:predicted nucleotidyltransferase
MKINSKDKILDVPILTIRDFLRKTRGLVGEPWPEGFAYQYFKFGAGRSKEILDELFRQGFIEKTENPEGEQEQYWQNTFKGNSLASATAAKSVTRETADRVFNEFMERVRKVNEDPYYLVEVSKLILFGSYIQDTPTLNDIDIAIELVTKENDSKRYHAELEQRRKNSKRVFRSMTDIWTWPHTEALLFLKSKSRVISLHPYEVEKELLKTIDVKVILNDEHFVKVESPYSDKKINLFGVKTVKMPRRHAKRILPAFKKKRT